MSDINCFTFTGRITADAAVRTIASGSKVMSMNVAVNYGFGDFKKTLFVKVQQWGDSVTKVVDYMKKGTLVAATGELSRSEWETKDGEKRVDFIVDVRSVQLLSSKKTENDTAEPVVQAEENYTF